MDALAEDDGRVLAPEVEGNTLSTIPFFFSLLASGDFSLTVAAETADTSCSIDSVLDLLTSCSIDSVLDLSLVRGRLVRSFWSTEQLELDGERELELDRERDP